MDRYFRRVIIGALAALTALWAQDVTLSFATIGEDAIEIYMENTVPVGGFQFILADDPDAITVTGASGGSAQTAGFMLSTNESGMILGFSLMGGTIPAGSAVLTTASVTATGLSDYAQLSLVDFIFSDASGGGLEVSFTQDDAYWGDPPMEDMLHFTVSPGTAEAGATGTVEVSLENTMEVGGFQFNLIDTPDLVTLTSAATTGRTSGFMMSTNESGMVLGFSLSGAVIAAGEGPIAVLTFEAGPNGGTAALDFSGMIVSDPDGNGLEPTADSGSFEVTGGYVPPPTITILEPADGAVISGNDIAVTVSGENMVEGDHYHAYLDGTLQGMFYEDSFTLTGVPFGMHTLTVTIADETHTDYENPEATATVGFENTDIVLEGYTLTLGTATVLAHESVDLPISLMNEGIVGGFQMRIIDFPNYAEVITINTTDRTEGFQVSFNEQGDGTVLVVGFDLTLQGIDPGTGPILNLEYLSTGDYDAELELSFNMTETILSDLVGVPIDFISENGMLIVDGIEPPPIFAPEELTALGGWEMVSLSWTHPEPWAVLGYYIYRDGVMVGESPIANYADAGLEAGITYCYTVVAYDEFTMSEPSNEACAETMLDFYEPPQELVAVENGLEIVLDWELPEGQEAIGGPCEGCDSPPCIFDCQMQCVNESTVNSWLGDGICDDGSWGIYLDCEYFNFDEGDCLEPNDPNIDPSIKEYYHCDGPQQTRDLLGYEVYRDNVMLDFVTDEHYVDTDGLWYLITYCYNVTAVYDEGVSGFSNTACATPQLGEPSGLTARGEGDYIFLEWDAHPDNAQSGFNIYRDGEFYEFVTETTYEDHGTEHDVEYCYYVTAFYEGIGESPATDEACSMWMLCPPSYLAAEAHDHSNIITWDETSCGEEVYLQYSSGTLANAFYFYDTYENGFAHGMRFDVGVDFDVLAASLYILHEGDQYWPWPNSTHGPVLVMVFDDNNGLPGNLLHSEEATMDETGYATIYPNLSGLTGSFHVIASHTENWSTGGDPEGFGIDDAVDYPDNMVTMQDGAWSTGDVLWYGGDYMVAALINAYGQVQPMSFGDLPSNPFTDFSDVAMVPGGGTLVNEEPSYPSYYHQAPTRELLSYDLFYEGNPEPIVTLDPDVFTYTDVELDNMVEYCYTMTANYTEGASEMTDAVCATPIPGFEPQNLTAVDMGGTIDLNWEEPMPLDNPVLDYQVYRDGEWVAETADLMYTDPDPIAGIEYCYTVTARYVSGESYPSNEACAVYILDEPVGVTAVGDNDAHGILVNWLEPGSLAILDIEILTDNYGGETSWTLFDANGGVVEDMPGGLSSYTEYNWQIMVAPGVYTWTIYDSYGDGICCSYGEGYYNIYVDGNMIATGGEFATEESVTFDTDAVLMSVSQSEYEYMMPYPKGTDLTPEQIAEIPVTDPIVVYENPNAPVFTNQNHQVVMNRELTGYEVHRDGALLVSVGPGVFEYFDGDTQNDVIYCYTVLAVYDDGWSLPSMEACAQWILPAPFGLTAIAAGSTIELAWSAAPSNDVLNYIVYREGEVLTTLGPNDLAFADETAIHDELYCYTVTALYDLGESAPTNEACAMWMLLPPQGLTATEGSFMIHLEWMEPTVDLCADEMIPALPFTATGSNVGLTNDWDVSASDGADYAYGLYVPVATTIDVTVCDAATNFDTKLEIFTADFDCNETTTGYYNDDDYNCEYGSLQSTITGAFLEAGQYYIVVDGFGGSEGDFGITVTDVGAGPVNEPVDPEEILAYEISKSGMDLTIEDINIPGPMVPQDDVERPLTHFNIYRDGEYIAQVPSGVFEYDDTGLSNLQEYCYTVTGLYDEGESPESNIACAIPIPGEAPTGLVAIGEGSSINLSWVPPAGEVIEYNVYREGEMLATVPDAMFSDETAEHDVLYCYHVTAIFPDGESLPSNEACGMWMILPPMGLTAMPGAEMVHLEWMEPATDLCADETIPALPFFAEGSNVGESDDWAVQGSQGADYAYGFYAASPMTIDVTVCDPATTFDTKLEIFTADFECNETTTGYYNDDATCEYSSLQSTITGAYLEAGQYYIVVDGFSGSEGNFGITVTESGAMVQPPITIEEAIAVESAKTGEHIALEDWTYADGSNMRPLIGFGIYFDDDTMIDQVGPGVFEYDVTGLDNLTTYCFYVTSIFDEGESPASNIACAMPFPGLAPSMLSATNVGDVIELTWTGGDENVIHYNIYRDGEAWNITTNTQYTDDTVEVDVEHCYIVTAEYPTGESEPTNESCATWTLNPPSQLSAIPDDQMIDLYWSEPTGGEEVALQYHDGTLANAFYFYDTYESGYAHGTRFDVGTDFDVMAASMYILSEGDQYWPWPNSTHGPITIMVFDDNNGLPGNLLHTEEATSDETGYATIYPNIQGLSGAFHVIVSHAESWSGGGDPEGFGIDGNVDYPDNMMTMQSGTWSTGDVLWYGGDYMTAALVFAYGEIMPMSYHDLPVNPYPIANTSEALHHGELEIENEYHPLPYTIHENTTTRELLSFNIYRDEAFLVNVNADVYHYQDTGLTNQVEYCYTMESVYDEGLSDLTNPVCATPYPGNPPTDLIAIPQLGMNHLEWGAADEDVIEYIIYRDGEFLDSTTDLMFDDATSEPGTLYCYYVTALYDTGESDPTNEACSQWDLDGVFAWIEAEGYEYIEVAWTEPGMTLCGDETIPNLPFESVGSNVGLTDDWDVSGSDGADYAYMLNVTTPTVIDVTVCSEFTTFDTKLEIFTADDDCNETTTGYYNDDSTCEYSGLQSTITGAALDVGQYYIVVDGYSGQEGEFGIVVTSNASLAQEPPAAEDLIAYENAKSGNEFYTAENWSVLPVPSNESRLLLGFQLLRDGVDFLGELLPGDQYSYTDLGTDLEPQGHLINGQEYCYQVIAVYEEGNSDPSPETCGSPNADDLCPPENFEASFTDGDSFALLTWEFPGDCEGGGGPTGDVLVIIQTDSWGNEVSWDITDSSGNIMESVAEGTLDDNTYYEWPVDLEAGTYTFTIYDSYGDGIYCTSGYYELQVGGETIAGGENIGCDYDYSMSHNFTTGGMLLSTVSTSFSEPVTAEKGAEIDMTGIELIEEVIYQNTERTERLDGYRIYRDGIEIATMGPEDVLYMDYGVTFGQLHCYYMTSVYGEWESNATDTDCVTVIDPGTYSVLSIESGMVEANSMVTLDISLENLLEVAGFQFTLMDTPDLLTVTDLVPTDRLTDWMVNYNAQDDGSIIVVGFNLLGQTLPVGEGPILEITFEAGNVLEPVEVVTSFTDVFLGDAFGNELPQFATSGTVMVNPAGAVELFMEDMQMMVGDVDYMDVSLTNDMEVAGFQFAMTMDGPPIMHMEETIMETPRTQGWSFTYAFGTVIGFSLTGATIAPGEGPIFTMTAHADAEGEGDMCFDEIVISDPNSNQLPAIGHCSHMEVVPEIQEDIIDLSAAAVEDGIELEWEIIPAPTREPVNLSLMDWDGTHLTVNMENTTAVAGFQFMLNSDIEGYELIGASGGSATDAGFMISTNSVGLVLGFSLTGATIPVGDGPLTILEIAVTGDEGCFTLSDFVFSDSGGGPIAVDGGEPFCIGEVEIYGCTDPEALNYNPEATIDDGSCIYDIYGCTDPEAINYNPEATIDDGSCIYEDEVTWNIYRDSELYTTMVGPMDEVMTWLDTAVESEVEYCYEVSYTDNAGIESDMSNEACATWIGEMGPVHFVVGIPETGESSLVVIENVDVLEPGDEIGLFDAAGILNSGDCSNELGELLVGSGVWTGEQLNIVGIGSIDNCDIPGGFQLPGYVDGNPIVYMVWDASEDVEYFAEATYSAGNGMWGSLITSATLEVITSVTQEVTLQPFMNNMMSFYVEGEDLTDMSVFGDNVFIAWNDGGDYYVPSFDIYNIGQLDVLDGYKVFINGDQPLTLTVEGMAADPGTPITWMPYMNNMFSYLPEEPMDMLDAFEEYEDDILLIKNDAGEYFVPSMGVETMTTLEPGKGYLVFTAATDPVEFMYPTDMVFSRGSRITAMEEFKQASVSEQYEITRTGMSHPIIITDLAGTVEVGDELVAYADGQVVGATKVVDFEQPLVIAAWEGYHEFGIELPGFETGSEIELRLWSAEQMKELRVEANLDNDFYGVAPLTSGSAVVYNTEAVPTEFTLNQNYPNPFNPTTTIEFSVPADSRITLKVYDITGREVTTLVDANYTTGYYQVTWDGTDAAHNQVAAGLYIYALQGENVSMTRKMVLMK